MSSCKKAAPKCVNGDNIKIAIEAINSAMRRKGLGLGDMYHAVNSMVDQAVNGTIVRLRESGCSIRKIARTVHMDDRRVAQVIKDAKKCECKGKECKPCKPSKKCKK